MYLLQTNDIVQGQLNAPCVLMETQKSGSLVLTIMDLQPALKTEPPHAFGRAGEQASAGGGGGGHL